MGFTFRVNNCYALQNIKKVHTNRLRYNNFFFLIIKWKNLYNKAQFHKKNRMLTTACGGLSNIIKFDLTLANISI